MGDEVVLKWMGLHDMNALKNYTEKPFLSYQVTKTIATHPVGEAVGKEVSSNFASGNANWCNLY